MGRAIRRLVTLYESLDDLLQAADDHAINENEDEDEEELLTEEALERKQEYADVYLFYSAFSKRVSIRSESRFEAFKILIQVLPLVEKAIEDPATDLDIYLTQVYASSCLFSVCSHFFIDSV